MFYQSEPFRVKNHGLKFLFSCSKLTCQKNKTKKKHHQYEDSSQRNLLRIYIKFKLHHITKEEFLRSLSTGYEKKKLLQRKC